MIAHFNNSLASCRSGLIALLLLIPLTADAAESYTLGLNGAAEVEELALPVGKSQIIQSDQPLSQVVVGDPNIANVQLLNENQFLVVGREPGITNLAFKDTNERIIAILDLVVGYDLVAIKRKLDDILPEERGILVGSSNGQVVLSGQVSSALAQDAALAVTETFAGENGIVNLLEVGGGQQVLLEARIAEIQRERVRDLGFQTEIDGGSGAETAFSLITGNPIQSAFGGIAVGNTSISDSLLAVLEALETQGAAQVLAEPNIVALSGQEASFLVGGEFPVPIIQSGSLTGAITIQFREFGVGLRFLPTVLSSERINLQMTTEVSDIDSSTGTSVLGTSVPGLRTRRVSTSIELGDGNSFAVAGLLQNDITTLINEFPGLASIPVLGALFRSTEFERQETELVIVITPRLVASVNRDSIALPTDNFRPPSSYDMIIQGRIEAPEPEPGQAEAEQGLDGAQGHQF